MIESNLGEFEAVIDRYQEGLFRFAFFRTGSMADSQDIVQGVFLRLWDRGKSLGTIENMKSYLYRAVSNACSDRHRRRQSMRIVPLDVAVTRFAESPDDQADMAEALREFERINALMGALPPDQAEVVRMRTVDSLSFTEIAGILQLPVTTVKSRFKYGIDKLRDAIK